MGIKSGEWNAMVGMRPRMVRRKIVKPIRPTNLYNVVRDFYRLAEEKTHAGASRCSTHRAVYARIPVFGMEMKDFIVAVKKIDKGSSTKRSSRRRL